MSQVRFLISSAMIDIASKLMLVRKRTAKVKNKPRAPISKGVKLDRFFSADNDDEDNNTEMDDEGEIVETRGCLGVEDGMRIFYQ